MALLFKLAFRNMFRYKRRTIITFLAVSLGLALLIIGISLLDGFDKQAAVNIVNSQTAHLSIFKNGYFEKKDELPLDLTIKNPAGLTAALENIPGVQAVESRILFAAGLIKGMDELPCTGVAIDPRKDPNIFNIKSSLTAGEWLEPGEMKALVGKDLARDVGLAPGDSVTLRLITSAKEGDFTWNAIDLEIKGIFDTGNPLVDGQRLFIPIDKAMEGLSLDNRVTEIAVRLNTGNEKDLLKMQNRVREILAAHENGAGIEVVTWKKLSGIFFNLSKSKKKNSASIFIIMMFIASVGIINTMMMAVFERTREIGMLAALGMKKNQVMGLFILEGGFIGIFGSIVGCLLGGLGGWYLEVYGWAIGSLGTTYQKMISSSFPLKDVFYGDVTIELLVLAFILGTSVSLLASSYPAYRAVKLNPIEALSYI